MNRPRHTPLSRLLPIICLISMFFACSAFAHAALLFAEDNGDGNIYIEAGISTGESAEGANVLLKDKTTGQTLTKIALPDSGKLYLPMPAVPYTITLDMGVGHVVTKTGPMKAAAATDTVISPVAEEDSKAYPKPSASLAGIVAIFIAAAAAGFIFTRKRKPISGGK